MRYKNTPKGVWDKEKEIFIPTSPSNRDYQAYVNWLKIQGNRAEKADMDPSLELANGRMRKLRKLKQEAKKDPIKAILKHMGVEL